MTQKTLEQYRRLLNEGAITVQEFDQILLQDRARRKANKPPQIKRMQMCCAAVMAGAVLTAVLSVLFRPPGPHLRGDMDFRGLFYGLEMGCRFLCGFGGGGCVFFVSLHAFRRFEDANEELGYAPNYRKAKRILLIAAVLLILLALHQIYRYTNPLVT